MSAHDRKKHEYLVRLEAEAAAAVDGTDEEQDDSARTRRIEHQAMWVETQIQQAMRRGEFDNLRGAGKPIPGIDRPHDPDWWLKQLVERERISALPPALALRTENERLGDELDRLTTAEAVRGAVEEFNARIVEARRQLLGGPPVITPLRDVDGEISAWQQRRTERVAEQKRRLAEIREAEAAARPSGWQRLTRRTRRS